MERPGERAIRALDPQVVGFAGPLVHRALTFEDQEPPFHAHPDVLAAHAGKLRSQYEALLVLAQVDWRAPARDPAAAKIPFPEHVLEETIEAVLESHQVVKGIPGRRAFPPRRSG